MAEFAADSILVLLDVTPDGALASSAACISTASTSGGCCARTAVEPVLMIPAFSAAIFPSVSPR